jgi:chromosome partitioning protein
MGRIIAIANQKGGVGKTTTAVNLSACLAAAGKRTLIVDLDPQGNATQGVGLDKNEQTATVYEALVNGSTEGLILPTGMDKLSLIAANRELAGAEVELVDTEQREYRLRGALQPIAGDYDYIFIDCPPSLGLLTLNGLVAADGILITLQCEYYALEGLSALLQTIMIVRDNYNPALAVSGVLLTMYQHTNLAKQVIDDVRAHLGDKVFKTVIPRNVTLSEAPSFGQPVIYYDLKSQGAQAYMALARELIARG